MKLEITDYSSGDIDAIWKWVPVDPRNVYFHLSIEISEKGKDGGTLFQLMVATPQGLLDHTNKHPSYPLPDRSIIVLPTYSWPNLIERLDSIVQKCTKGTWNESIMCLQRYFQWEYEDLQPECG